MARSPARANPGRVAAAKACRAVEDGAFAEEAQLPSGADGRLAWHLIQGTLRHRAEVDAALQRHLKQPLDSLDPPVRWCLRLGAFEKLHGRAPARAVVQQWVEVAKRVKAGRAHGLINAVLRRVESVKQPTLEQRLNHPAWLVRRWIDQRGEAWTEQRCAANQQPARTCVVFHDTRPEGLEPAGPDGAFWFDGPLPIEAGWVMDPAAVEVADRFAEAVGQGTVLDACASPGGKTLRLWSRGLEVVAADRQPRLARLNENLERLGAKVHVKARDWGRDQPTGTYQGILVDAPCSGLGTLRRHPEIRWRRKESDLLDSQERQLQILARLADSVLPGGVLGYAVCSPEPEEGPQVVSRFLEGRKDYTLESTWEPTDFEHDAHQLFLLRRTHP